MQLGNHRLTALPYRKFLQIQDNPIEKWQGHAPAQSCPILCDPLDYSLPGSPSMGFFSQEYWSGLLCCLLGDLPNPGIELRSSALQAGSLPAELPGKPLSLGGSYD